MATVYHYTRLSTALEHILPTMKLRLGRLAETNDPREKHLWRFTNIGAGEEIRDHSLAYDAAHHAADGVLRRGAKVACFTEDRAEDEQGPAIQGWARPRMWAQYADGHRGVCLGFDLATLRERAKQHAEDGADVRNGPVRYIDLHDRTGRHGVRRDDVRGAEMIDMDRVKAVGLEQALIDHRERYYEDLFLTKHRDWADEWEFRFLLFSSDENPRYVSIRDSLTDIVAGVDFPDVYWPLIERLTEGQAIRLGQVRVRNGLDWWIRCQREQPIGSR